MENGIQSFKKLIYSTLLLSNIAFAQNTDWPTVSGAPSGGHYSTQMQITPANVNTLKTAWIYRTGDVSQGTSEIAQTTFEATPILFQDKLFFCTPYNRVIALDPTQGKAFWTFDPHLDKKILQHGSAEGNLICRGVASWSDPINNTDSCAARIFTGTQDGRLIALDAKTGRLCKSFGNNGTVNLRLQAIKHFSLAQLAKAGVPLQISEKLQTYLDKVSFGQTSAPAVINNIVVIGSAISDNLFTVMPSGIVQAFDARSGQPVWTWDPIPDHAKLTTGAGNVWAPISVDPIHNLIFIGTSSPSPDFYGGLRTQPFPLADAIVALDANTGKTLWHFQTVHHDLMDYDIAAQPTLINLNLNNKDVPVVVVATKTAFIFAFEALTGKSIFPIEERLVPRSFIPGEKSSPTQPIPILPAPLINTILTEKDMWGLTPFDRQWCVNKFRQSRYDGLFTPPSLQGTILFPMTGGGINWGGVAYSPESGLLIVNYSRVAHIIKLLPNAIRNKVSVQDPHGLGKAMFGTPYGIDRTLFLSPLNIPCNAPPWGMLAAIDMKTGQIRWQHPFGTVKVGPFNSLERWGSPNLGGSAVTASGLIFIGASMDNQFHAYNVWTGQKLWETALPFVGSSTPMIFEIKGREYVVIATGGFLNGPKKMVGDSLVAFTLPEH